MSEPINFKKLKLTNINTALKINVINGDTSGSSWWVISCTRPLVICDCFISIENKFNFLTKILDALSAILYNAQKFGAQYAWHKPLLNGNNLDITWFNWFYKRFFSDKCIPQFK